MNMHTKLIMMDVERVNLPMTAVQRVKIQIHDSCTPLKVLLVSNNSCD